MNKRGKGRDAKTFYPREKLACIMKKKKNPKGGKGKKISDRKYFSKGN